MADRSFYASGIERIIPLALSAHSLRQQITEKAQ